MNRHGAVEIAWAGGEHTFRLGLGEIEELEKETDLSVFVLLPAMSGPTPLAKLRHYSTTIRIGLLGGGMNPVEARALTRKWVDERPLYESVALAQAILHAAIERVHPSELDDALGEAEAARSSASTSPQSTAAQEPSASPTSGNSPSASGQQSSQAGTRPTAMKSRSPRQRRNLISP